MVQTLKKLLRIILTNWIHLVGFYVTTFLTLILAKAVGLSEESDTWIGVLVTLPFSILLLFYIYGYPIIGGFCVALIVLDIICFRVVKISIWKIILLEWILIIPIFFMWAFEYKYWLWISLSLSFLVTQLIRRTKIEKLLEGDNEVKSVV
jgi:hypothetical protein